LLAVFFEYVAKKTIHKRGEKTVWVKCAGASKERATVMLLGDSDGTRYTPTVVFKAQSAKSAEVQAANLRERRGFGPRVWMEMQRISKTMDLQLHGNPKGKYVLSFCC
jgi:hypothetical protein